MFSADNFDSLLHQVFGQPGGQNSNNTGKSNGQGNMNTGSGPGNGIPGLTPAQALVIAGFLGGVMKVDSILVGRDQHVEIVLVGNLRQETQLDKIMKQIGSMPFDEVMKSVIRRLEG